MQLVLVVEGTQFSVEPQAKVTPSIYCIKMVKGLV